MNTYVMEDRTQRVKKERVYFIGGDVGEKEAWVRGENKGVWAMMGPIFDICVWLMLRLSISKYTAGYKLLISKAKDTIWIAS